MAATNQDNQPFDIKAFFAGNGQLANMIEHYIERPEQTAMALTIDQALQEPGHCLAEAGTGIGKSLAYLVPGLAWAVANKTRLLISTHTKALQLQLLNYELPRIAKETLFGQPIKVELCVGADNYICLLRLIKLANHPQGVGLEADGLKMLANVLAWSREEVSGLKQDCPESIPEWLWKKIAIIRETCIGRHCPYFEDCFLQLARKKQRQAQVLITNHSFFFANIITEGKLLPDFTAVVMDEAHKIEDVATQFFSDELSQSKLTELLQTIMDPGRGSVLQQLSGLADDQIKEAAGLATTCLKKMTVWWQSLLTIFAPQQDTFHYLDSVILKHKPPTEELLNCAHLLASFAEVCDTEEERKTIDFLTGRVKNSAQVLDDWVNHDLPDRVYWAERYYHHRQVQARIVLTPLELSHSFRTLVLDAIPSVTLVSATIAVQGKFDYLKNRLGIRKAWEIVLDSPFPYEEQAALYVPPHVPEPNQGSLYEEKIIMETIELINCFGGGVFVLFTNYRFMQRAAQRLRQVLPDEQLLVQGDAPPHQLIKTFQNHRHAVMLGVETFWQGVDVPGEALRCVILTRLPFDVPTHPIYLSRADYLTAQGKNPFVSYALPRAMLMLRQGFGRLIRHHHDRGVVAILDARVRTRSWGKRFITMLPACQQLTRLEQVRQFVARHFKQQTDPSPAKSTPTEK